MNFVKKTCLVFLCAVGIISTTKTTDSLKRSKVLIGSVLFQSSSVIKEFLYSLEKIKKDTLDVDFFFIDHGLADDSLFQLINFVKKSNATCTILKDPTILRRLKSSMSFIWGLAEYKNKIISKALEDKYDYLFLIDADIIQHPATIEHLINQNKEIISTIFWTFNPYENCEAPQVWLHHPNIKYKLLKKNEVVSSQEREKRTKEFYDQLRQPGTYEVGGLGACTLVSSYALKSGVTFSRVKNISFYSEDCHFCLRASARNVSLFVNTHYPAYHLVDPNNVVALDKFKKESNLI